MFIRNYYVIFERANQQAFWWNHIINKDFAHVFCVYEHDDKTVIINMGTRYAAINVVDQSIHSFICDMVKADVTAILKVKARQAYHYYPAYRWGWNCVGMTKAVLNIKGLQFTPRQLYNKLKAKSVIIHEDLNG
jgi:hypothetical protein